MDDDVQYLGTKFAPVDTLDDDPCEVHPSLTGITLHVDKWGDKPAHDLTFYRARSCYVNIGRKSASDDRSMRRANDDHNVVFSCQVISARHAKLVFSDSGQVYIVDLHSRHGTHLLKRGDPAPRMLQPEVETLLSDGDILTFGKAVGAGSYHVSPVTVRVELLNDGSSSEPFKIRAHTPFDAQSPVLSRPRKLSSGRYGLISQATSCVESSDSPHSSSSSISISSDAPSTPSEQGSDVDEHDCIPAILRDAQEKTSLKIPTFRSFIRDMYHTSVSHPSVIPDVPGESLEGEASDTPPSAEIVRQPSPPLIILESPPRSRSHSPMEVATPSPSPSPPPEAYLSEPAIIGAWPPSRPESPRSSPLEELPPPEVHTAPEPERREPELVLTPPVTYQNRIAPMSNDAIIELMHRLPPPPFFPMGGPFSNSITSDFGLPPVPHPPPPPPPPPMGCRIPPCRSIPPFHLHKAMTDCVSTEVKGSLKGVEDRINALQETVDDLRSRQTVTEEDVVDIQSNFETFEPLFSRIAGTERNIATLSMLQGQMNTLQNQVTTLRGKLEVADPKSADNMDDFKVCATALNNLVSEMRSLREDMEKRIEAKVDTIQKARTEALDALKEVVSEAEHVRTSKRKRDDEMEEDEAPDAAAIPDAPTNHFSLEGTRVPEVSTSIQEVLSEDAVSLAKPDGMCYDESCAVEPIRPRKRARKVMHTVVHTAAAMAVGAVTAWSALAFS